jgi:hypothetical protein
MGISPAYFLDEMSMDEIASLIKVYNEKEKKQWERDRLYWYYITIAPGLSKIHEPKGLITFDWETKKTAGKKISREKAKDIGNKLENIING